MREKFARQDWIDMLVDAVQSGDPWPADKDGLYAYLFVADADKLREKEKSLGWIYATSRAWLPKIDRCEFLDVFSDRLEESRVRKIEKGARLTAEERLEYEIWELKSAIEEGENPLIQYLEIVEVRSRNSQTALLLVEHVNDYYNFDEESRGGIQSAFCTLNDLLDALPQLFDHYCEVVFEKEAVRPEFLERAQKLLKNYAVTKRGGSLRKIP